MERVFVTGGNSSMGSILVEKLAGPDCTVHYPYVNDVDILDFKVLEKTIEDFNPDTIVHAAATVSTWQCETYDNQSLKTNIEGTNNIVNIARRNSIKLVYFSSSAAYGTPTHKGQVFTEDSPVNPTTLYAISKYAGEQIVKGYLPKSLVIRPCFLYAPGDNNAMINHAIRENKRKFPVMVHLDPNKRKGYLWAEEGIGAIIQLMKQNESGVFNVCTDKKNFVPYSRVIELLRENGVDIPIYMIPEKDWLGDHILSNEKLRSTIDFKPKMTLEEGIKRCAEYK